MITRAETEEIFCAFGALSTLETTTTVDEVWADANTFGSPRAYIETQIAVEDVMGDRMAASARAREESGEPEYRDHHLHVVADEVEFLKLIKDRCKALMARKGW